MTRGTHSTVEQAPIVGDAIGRYRIIGVLGDGRLGRLYVAEQHEIRGVSKIVALRYVRPAFARSPQFRARFLEAARMATRCDHPSVVTVFELGNVDGRSFISMEYLPGENVASILRRCNTREAVSADIAAYVVKQAATALQYLHDLREASPQRVSTRPDEVDPTNVFVSYHGTVKYLGFGLRSLVDAAESDAVGTSSPADVMSHGSVSDSVSSGDATSLASTPSPASAIRSPATADVDAERRAGVLELGALLWTCLIGEKPPLAGVLDAPAASGATPLRHPGGPRSVRADVPDALDAIVRRALSPDPRDRYDSPRAMADELDQYLLQREPRPTPKHLRRWMEQLFDAERASLQMQIARGRDVEAALSHLGAEQPGGSSMKVVRAFSSPRPRELWSTSHAMFPQFSRASIAPPRSFERVIGGAPDESRVTAIPSRHLSSGFGSAPTTLANAELPPLMPLRGHSSRAGIWGVILAGCAVVAIGALFLVSGSRQSSPLEEPAPSAASADRSGRVDVRSDPEGAAVFVDGEPTGLRTPVVLKGLAAGRTIRVRVDKAGFASQEQQIEVVAGSLVTRAFELDASAGLVHFAGAPPDARVYIDDVAVAVRGGTPVNLSVGPHIVRVETPSALLFSGTVDVVAGEQTLQVGGGAGP